MHKIYIGRGSGKSCNELPTRDDSTRERESVADKLERGVFVCMPKSNIKNSV